MANLEIRMEAKRHGVFLWQVAARCGMIDGNFSRKLRKELPPEEKKKILGIIAQLAGEGNENG